MSGKPDIQVAGAFFCTEQPSVELDAPLTPALRPLQGDDASADVFTLGPAQDGPEYESHVVHGVLTEDGEEVTLVDAFTAGRRYSPFDPSNGSQRLVGRYALLGGHVRPEAKFRHIRLRLEHLETWVALPGFSLTSANDELVVGLELETPVVPPAHLAEGVGRLAVEQVTHIAGPTHLGGRLERSVWLRTEGLSGTVDELGRRIVIPLASLTTLAVGRACRPVELEFAAEAAGPWLRNCLAIRQAGPHLESHRVLLPFSEIGTAGVAAWLNQVNELGPLPAVVADAATTSGRSLEAQVLELTTVAEGLHRRLFATQSRVEPKLAAQARSSAVQGVEHLGQPVTQAVREALGHLSEPTYRERMVALAEAAEVAVPGVAGRVDHWASKVVKARNAFAHLLPQGPPGTSAVDDWLTVTQSLRWLLTGLLLLQTGVAPESLGRRFEQHPPYRLFRRQAQSWLPQVYGN